MSYTLEKIFILLGNFFEVEINKMKLFLDIKNHPEYLKKKIINKGRFNNWTKSLHTIIGFNEFSYEGEMKTSLFKTIIIQALLDDEGLKELKEFIFDFLIQL